MNSFITAIVVWTSVLLLHGAENSKLDTWSKEGLTKDERTALVEDSKKGGVAEIAPDLLKALVDYQPFYGINPIGDTPWNDERLSIRDRVYLMASAVWHHHMTPRDDLNKAKALLGLLQNSSRIGERSILISALLNYQWCPEAEDVLLGIAKSKKEDDGIRRQSVSTLLSRCDLNTYMPLAVEIILAHKKGLDRCQAFNFATNQGNRLFSLSDQNKRIFLAAGFDVINELPEKDIQTGYFVARRLGFVLRAENEFAPDQKDEKYQGKHGLSDEFFIDTVKNAITWYSKHEEEIKPN